MIPVIIQHMHPQDHWTLKTGVILWTLSLRHTGSNTSIGGSKILRANTHTYYLYVDIKTNIFINRATTTKTWNPVMASWLVATVYIHVLYIV